MTSLSASLLCKILTVFLLFCLTKASGGTCLSYGHSCWGGHGKRNGMAHFLGNPSQKKTGSWYISKLFSPSVSIDRPNKLTGFLNNPNSDDEESEKVPKYGYQIYPIPDALDINDRDSGNANAKVTNWGVDVKDSEEDVLFLSPDVQSAPISKYKLFQIMVGDDLMKPKIWILQSPRVGLKPYKFL